MSVYLSEDVIRLDLPATHKYLNLLSACIAEVLQRSEISEREELIYNIQLAAHEACTNIVSHAYQGQPGGRIAITLTVAHDPKRLILEFQDTGRSFELGSAPTPDLSQAHVHGYGLFLMRSLMDEMSYVPQPQGNHWCLMKYL